ncbi:MAG: hypothetical protein AAB731_04755, partial [Patescibacteria group bacterium]
RAPAPQPAAPKSKSAAASRDIEKRLKAADDRLSAARRDYAAQKSAGKTIKELRSAQEEIDRLESERQKLQEEFEG